MNQLFMLVLAMALCTASFAGIPSSGTNTNSPQIKALGSVWTSHHTAPRQDKNDLTMVYGGEDVDPSSPTQSKYTVAV